MLSQFEKVNLHKILESQSFEHLRPPPLVYSIQVPQSEYFTEADSDNPRRRIYYNVLYEPRQLQIISEIKAELILNHIHEKIADELILKHAYMAKFDKHKVVQRLKDAISYHLHPIITKFDQSTISKLAKGCFYTYGCDRGLRPIVVLRVERVNFSQNFEEIMNPYYYLMLIVYAFRLVPYHAQKMTLLVDLKNVPLSSMPLFSLYDELKKIGIFYCGSTERALFYNASGIGMIWSVVSRFLTESQKKKLVIIPEGEEKKALEFIDPYQLESQYGGKLPNLTEYWPFKSVSEEAQKSCISDFSEYFSVVNDQQFFKSYPTQTNNGCCSGPCSCIIY